MAKKPTNGELRDLLKREQLSRETLQLIKAAKSRVEVTPSLEIRVIAHEGRVMFDLGQLVRLVSQLPDEAEAFGTLLRNKAIDARKQQKEAEKQAKLDQNEA